jgi:hypothetical protein
MPYRLPVKVTFSIVQLFTLVSIIPASLEYIPLFLTVNPEIFTQSAVMMITEPAPAPSNIVLEPPWPRTFIDLSMTTLPMYVPAIIDIVSPLLATLIASWIEAPDMTVICSPLAEKSWVLRTRENPRAANANASAKAVIFAHRFGFVFEPM